ncbi:hypothetical protein ULMS_02460 [Patiriisocius marinistellae]|uniref:HTH luxR-type domain-containing protein n=1 Tax=Patiriisocius marinistellae TaxID=2494560 RepID=A0A5J4FUD6_9FLAO|nr:LuxR C-terminal-related transcriptional regulator [Patiriisocius marinistellae]GEQ84738.1 hypothetical protein ULMS_02460 [Patiriisocius marinistellae]
MASNHPISRTSRKKLAALSSTEIVILKLIKLGCTSIQIAERRDCSKRTVEKHRSNIIKKLGLTSSQQALYFYLMKNPDF